MTNRIKRAPIREEGWKGFADVAVARTQSNGAEPTSAERRNPGGYLINFADSGAAAHDSSFRYPNIKQQLFRLIYWNRRSLSTLRATIIRPLFPFRGEDRPIFDPIPATIGRQKRCRRKGNEGKKVRGNGGWAVGKKKKKENKRGENCLQREEDIASFSFCLVDWVGSSEFTAIVLRADGEREKCVDLALFFCYLKI